MNADFDSDLVDEFKQEALDSLDDAEKALLSIDKPGQDFKTHYNQLFRTFHSLKGGAGMLGMDALQGYLHFLENLLSQNDTKENFSSELADIFLKGLDTSRGYFLQTISEADLIQIHKAAELSRKDGGNTKAASLPQAKNQEANPLNNSPQKVHKPESQMPCRGKIDILATGTQDLNQLANFLGQSNYLTRNFSDKETLVKASQHDLADAIVIDADSNLAQGMELLKHLKYSKIVRPCIVVAKNIAQTQALQLLEMGGFCVLEKPISSHALLHATRAAVCLNKHRELLDQSFNLIMYQFADLGEFLKKNGREKFFAQLSQELQSLMQQRHELRKL